MSNALVIVAAVSAFLGLVGGVTNIISNTLKIKQTQEQLEQAHEDLKRHLHAQDFELIKQTAILEKKP